MYKAEIKSKEIVDDRLRVIVRFYNDERSFETIYEIVQKQANNDWPYTLIKKKLDELDHLSSYKEGIVEGEVARDTLASTEETKVDDKKEEYRQDLLKFEKYVSVITKGFTTEENAVFLALKDKLATNFKDEYLDLF